MAINDDLADRTITSAVAIHRYDASLRARILGILHSLFEELTSQIEKVDVGSSKQPTVRRKRVEVLEARVRRLLASYFSRAGADLNQGLVELSKLYGRKLPEQLNEIIGVDIVNVTLTPTELKALALSSLIDGNPASEWWAKQEANTRVRFMRQIRLGVAAGETNDQIVRRVRGRRAGTRTVIVNGAKKRVSVFSGGVINATTREAEALVRTAVQAISNNAILETYKANSDVIRGVQALVTLDGRTTLLCISRSQSGWFLDGSPFPESPRQEPFPGPPPWHFNCRTVLSPVTKSWEDLMIEAGVKVVKEIKDVTPQFRASMDGLVAHEHGYESWLKTKPVGFQKEVLGPARWKLWREGKLTLSQLTDFTGRALTLEELEKQL